MATTVPAEPASETPPPRSQLPAYVTGIWQALRRYSASAKEKHMLAEVFIRQLHSSKDTEARYRRSFRSPETGLRCPDEALRNFMLAEKLGLLACGLEACQIEAITAEVCELLQQTARPEEVPAHAKNAKR